jgi:hypothetical protein
MKYPITILVSLLLVLACRPHLPRMRKPHLLPQTASSNPPSPLYNSTPEGPQGDVI